MRDKSSSRLSKSGPGVMPVEVVLSPPLGANGEASSLKVES